MGFHLAQGLLRYIAFLIAITMYQAAIAIMAKKKGDKSLATQQLATLNPLPHIDLIGTVLFPFITILLESPIVFGWPKMHNVQISHFKNIKKDLTIVYSSGVALNFMIAFICMIILRYLGGGFFFLNPAMDLSDLNVLFRVFLAIVGFTNLTLGALFLLPLPGSAGWYIIIHNVNYNLSQKLQTHAFWISIAGLILIISGLLNIYFMIFANIFQSISMTSILG